MGVYVLDRKMSTFV